MDDKPRAGIYCRISVAKVDDRTKVTDQERRQLYETNATSVFKLKV